MAEIFIAQLLFERCYFKSIEAKTCQLESVLGKVELIPSEVEDRGRRQASTLDTEVSSMVFIIHGHDEEMKRNVQLFLKEENLKTLSYMRDQIKIVL